MRMQQLPLTATTISPLPRIPTAQHGCNGCVGKESDRIMTTSEKHPKIHRIALVDNDPRALDSLSAVIACKVPTAYVVWTATSGDEAIERCQDANSNVSLLILSGGTHRLRFPRGIVARSLLFPTVSGRQLGLQLLEQEIVRWSLPPKMHLSSPLPASDA